jgi:ABC-type phosphate/phosphonate transport system ATPase subunit
MLSCVEHGCLLLPERDVAVARALGEQIKPVPAGEPLATLDR